MTGIPIRPEEPAGIRGKKQTNGLAKTRQIELGCVFIQSLDTNGESQRDPSTSHFASFEDISNFGKGLQTEACTRGYATIQVVVFFGVGADWKWNMAVDRFRGAVHILECFRACEHLLQLCEIHEPNPERA